MLSRSFFRTTRSTASAVRAPQRSSISTLIRSSATPFSRTQSLPHRALRTPSARWYSDAAEQKPAAESAAPREGEAVSEVETLKKDIEAKNKELAQLKDQYIRQVADYRNLQTRTTREAKAAKDFALQSFVRDLVQSIDNLEHALSSVPAEKLVAPATGGDAATVHADLVSLHKGLVMIEDVMMGTLKKHGVTRFDPAAEAEAFDPNRHEAVFQAPMPGKEDGSVFHTQQKGFLLNGRVLRAAQVGVVKNS